jgi:hypothetical protein
MNNLAIAVVEYEHHASGLSEWCKLSPTHIQDGGSWRALGAEELEDRFPPRGKIYWYRPVAAHKGTFWIIRYSENPNSATDRGDDKVRDKYLVDEGAPIPIFEAMRSPSDDLALRRAIADASLSFATAPIGPVYLQVPSRPSHWIGPVSIGSQVGSDRRFHCAAGSASGFMDVHEVNVEYLQRLRLGSKDVRTLLPSRAVRDSVGHFNVQTDDQLLDSALRRIRKLNRHAAEGLSLTKAVFAKYVESLQNADLVGSQDKIEAARLDALSELLRQLRLRSEQADAIADALLNRPQVAEALDRLKAARLDELTSEMRTSAEAATSRANLAYEAARLQQKQAEQELLAATKRLEEARSTLQHLDAEVARAPQEFALAVRKQMTEFRKKPGDLLAEVFLGDLIRHGLYGEVAPIIDSDFSLPAPAGVPISEPGRLIESAVHHADARALDAAGAALVAALILAGRDVLLFGPAAELLSEAIACALVGGRACRFPMPANVFSPNDVLELREVTLPSCTLKKVLDLRAAVPTLTILTGVDRAPLELSIADLLRATSNQVSHLGILGTLIGGPSTFRVPLSVRAKVAVVHARFATVVQGGDADKLPMSYISQLSYTVEISQPPETLRAALAQANLHIPSANREYALVKIAAFAEPKVMPLWLVSRLAGLLPQDELTNVVSTLSTQQLAAAVTSESSLVAAVMMSE